MEEAEWEEVDIPCVRSASSVGVGTGTDADTDTDLDTDNEGEELACRILAERVGVRARVEAVVHSQAMTLMVTVLAKAGTHVLLGNGNGVLMAASTMLLRQYLLHKFSTNSWFTGMAWTVARK